MGLSKIVSESGPWVEVWEALLCTESKFVCSKGLHSDARLFCKNKLANLKNKPEMVNLTEKQAQSAFGKKIQKNVKPAG